MGVLVRDVYQNRVKYLVSTTNYIRIIHKSR